VIARSNWAIHVSLVLAGISLALTVFLPRSGPDWILFLVVPAFAGLAISFVLFWIALVVGLTAKQRLRTLLHANTGLLCPGCGYHLLGVSGGRCPECGRAWGGVSKEWRDEYCVALPRDNGGVSG
jgi:hypothetical protein